MDQKEKTEFLAELVVTVENMMKTGKMDFLFLKMMVEWEEQKSRKRAEV